MSWSDSLLEDQSLYVNTKELEAFQSSRVFSYTQVPALAALPLSCMEPWNVVDQCPGRSQASLKYWREANQFLIIGWWGALEAFKVGSNMWILSIKMLLVKCELLVKCQIDSEDLSQ